MIIVRDVIYSQSKGCSLFIQVGSTVLAWQPKWAKGRQVALLYAEVFTPRNRFRVGWGGI